MILYRWIGLFIIRAGGIRCMSIRYASKQEELYHIILENLPEGVNVVDTEGYIIYSNISSGKYANANPADMVGKHVTVYFPRAA